MASKSGARRLGELFSYAAFASQADTAAAVEVVDAALDHSSHRDRASGHRITDLIQELQKTADELAGTPVRPSRSNGGQSHRVVTPRVEASPDRSDFAKLGEATAAEQERTRQFADDVRSQVADRELAQRSGRVGFAAGRGRWRRLFIGMLKSPITPASRAAGRKFRSGHEIKHDGYR